MRFLFVILLSLFSFGAFAQGTDTTSTNDIVLTQDSTVQSTNTSQDTTLSFIDKVMSHFEYNHGRMSVKYYPSMGLDPASGLSLGLLSLVSFTPKTSEKKLIRFYRPTSISTSATYSTKNWLNLNSTMMIYAKHGIVINTLVQFQISPDKFYGIGNDTLNTDPLKFDIKDLRVSGNVSKELSSTCYLGFVFDMSYRSYSTDEINSHGLELPEQRNHLLLGLGPHFTYDRRDNVNYPTNGEYITFGIKYFAPHSKDAYSFYCFDIDVRKYFTIYKRLVLGLQVFSGISEGEMPFYSLYQLGGQTRMRGLSNKYMYIDKNAYYAQCEFRQSLFRRCAIVAFGGMGNTYDDVSNFRVDHIKYIVGAGLRFQSDTRNHINLRLDYAIGSFHDSGLYMTMREAF